MIWKKKGLICSIDSLSNWAKSHVHVVCVINYTEDILRVYFSSRDDLGRCKPSYLDLDANNPSKILNILDRPILDLGDPGTFDDCGIMPTWVIKDKNEFYLYYIGWNVRNTVPYHNSIGLASSSDGHLFNKKFHGPIIQRNHLEPYFNGSACILKDNGVFKMWYLSCTKWEEINNKKEPFYNIKYAESFDGIIWKRNNITCIDFLNNNEGGISRPSVIIENGIYKMWYSYRGKTNYRQNEDINQSYRIGYAESLDGITWKRLDDSSLSLDISRDSEWDNFMLEYPCVIDVKGKRYMFYNGNGFGETGFGYAVLDGK